MGYLLDTNIVSLAMRGDQNLLARIYASDVSQAPVCICGITYFEIRRGLLAKNATAQMRKFETLLKVLPIIPLDDVAIFEQAAVIYADLQQRGQMIQTEDILIAATAIAKDLTMVSRDEDLGRVAGLSLENWQNSV